jgi:parallel beta-helix repeat protein
MLSCLLIITTILITSVVSSSTVITSDLIQNSKTIYVDDDGTADYTKIQDAIDNASIGDTIFVYNGTYCENIMINKSLIIQGENKTNTIIDGGENNYTVHIQSEDVELAYFTITNSSKETRWYYAGIRIDCSNNWIHDSIINNNNLGMFCKRVTNITINDNTFTGDGVTFSLYDDEESWPFNEDYFIHNVCSNIVNGRKLYYYLNEKDVIVPQDAGQVIAVNCKKMVIKNLNLSNADYGCILVNCSGCLIEKTNISFGDGMLWLIHSNNNKILKNQISNNFEGVCLDCHSSRNLVKNNIISDNELLGIIIEDKSNCNKIFRNTFLRNFQKPENPQAYFKYCHGNRWRSNYWNRPRIFPVVISGKLRIGPKEVPWINFDFFPAKIPISI